MVVGTHPHEDHIGGMPEFLELHGQQVDEYWEPGYYHPSGGYLETMLLLEDAAHVQRTQPTSGTTRFIGNVKITVLAPGVGLRGRFDSYGIMVNDASIALKVEFPAARVSQATEGGRRRRKRTYHRVREPWSLILGADAQTTSWAQASVDFPQLHSEANPVLYRELRAARGADPLRAQVFKVSHHASKHGVNLELVERMAPLMALVSSTHGGGRYNFPHHLAMEAVREGIQPSTTKQPERPKDHELGIHYTCARLRGGRGRREEPLGSMAVLFPPRRGSDLQLWRFFDEPSQPLELERARMFKRVRHPT